MKLLVKNLEILKIQSRKIEFVEFIKNQQDEFSRFLNNYDFSLKDIDIFLQGFRENVDKIYEKATEKNNTLINITNGVITNIQELVGDFEDLLTIIDSEKKEFILSASWYHDALINIASIDNSSLLKNLSFGKNTYEYLEKSRYQLEHGFEKLRASVIEPVYAKAALRNFYRAKKLLDDEDITSPYLLYCMALCKFYFEFDFTDAIPLFEQAVLDSKYKKGNEKFVATCNYELGKLYLLTGDLDKAIDFLYCAFKDYPSYHEPQFQLLRVLAQSRNAGIEIFSILQNLTDESPLYLLKILMDNELLGNENVLTWLCGFVDTAVSQTQEKLDEAMKEYGTFLTKQPFSDELRNIEASLQRKQYAAVKKAAIELNKLIKQINIAKKEAEKNIAELQSEYSYYKHYTWDDNEALIKFGNYINELKVALDEGFTSPAVNAKYDIGCLKKEKSNWEEDISKYNNKYDIEITTTSRNEVEQQVLALRLKKIESLLNDKRYELTKTWKESGFVYLVSLSLATLYFHDDIKKWLYDNWGGGWYIVFIIFAFILWIVAAVSVVILMFRIFSIIFFTIKRYSLGRNLQYRE